MSDQHIPYIPRVPVFKDICRYFDPVKGFNVIDYLIVGSRIIEPTHLYGEVIESIGFRGSEVVMKTNKNTYTYNEPEEFLVEKEGYRIEFAIDYIEDAPAILIVEPEINITELVEIARQKCMETNTR